MNILKLISVQPLKCRPFTPLPLKNFGFPCRWKATSVRLPSQSIVIANLCEKLKCTETIAKDIYDKCPELRRSIDAIQNDSLQILSKQLSFLSIIENPELITVDLDTLKRKIELLNIVKPKSLDDFAPLLQMNEEELKTIVCKRMINERYDIGEYGNRIYYISERLQVLLPHHCQL